MAATRLISIIGRKGAGKTTLTVALLYEFVRRGKRVMTMKHGHHWGDLDKPGTDSWRHRREGGAARVLLAGPEGRVVFEEAEDLYDPVTLAQNYLQGADIILVEGYKRAPVPKIEIWRRELSDPMLYNPADPLHIHWKAIVTDHEELTADIRIIRFRDTMWLNLLASLAWEEALELP